jgi:hypothetical protein
MENKYYTPKIEEFHVGFRYEQFAHEGGIAWSGRLYDAIQKSWIKNTFEIDSPYSLVDIANYIDSGFIRIKKLDESDIIEAGWEESKTSFSPDRQYYSLNEYNCFLKDGEFRIYYEWAEDGQNLFVGSIPNYNKLLEVMDMIGVERGKNKKNGTN